MTLRSLSLALLSFLFITACSKKDTLNPPNNPFTNPTTDTTAKSDENTYKQGSTLLVDDLVLYTTDGAHRDPQLIKDFMTRKFPEYINTFFYGQTKVTGSNISESLVFLDGNRVKLHDTIMEIVSKTDTQMMLAALDSTDMPGPESEWIGRCMVLYDRISQYNPYSICSAAGGNCKKYRKTYPVIISGKDYFIPILHYAVYTEECSIIWKISSPEPNFFNKDFTYQLRNKDSVVVQIARVPMVH